MIITLTPAQFQDLNKVIEASRRAMSTSNQGELTLQEGTNTDAIQWDQEEIKITLED